MDNLFLQINIGGIIFLGGQLIKRVCLDQSYLFRRRNIYESVTARSEAADRRQLALFLFARRFPPVSSGLFDVVV